MMEIYRRGRNRMRSREGRKAWRDGLRLPKMRQGDVFIAALLVLGVCSGWADAVPGALLSDAEFTQAVTQLTQAGDPAQRRKALDELGQLKDPRAVPFLIRALDDNDQQGVGLLAVGTLMNFSGTMPVLLSLVQNTLRSEGQRAYAIQRLGHPEGLPVLKDIAANPSEPPVVRGAALSRLGMLKDASALPLLFAGLQAGDLDVELGAIQGLAANDSPLARQTLLAIVNDEEESPTLRQMTVKAVKWGAEGVPFLLTLVASKDEGLRLAAIEGMEHLEMEDSRIVPVLEKILNQDPDPGIQNAAAHALGRQGLQALPALTLALTHSDLVVRVHAVSGIGRVSWKETRALEVLQQLVFHPEPMIRMEALYALLGTDLGKSLKVLCQALVDPDPIAREIAASVLDKSQDTRILPMLTEMLKHKDARARRGAVEGLSYHGAHAEAALASVCDDPDPIVRDPARLYLKAIQAHTPIPRKQKGRYE